ncbi:MAG: ankyrin repeat domain-containing protein, partial [Bacteroidota bacterium]
MKPGGNIDLQLNNAKQTLLDLAVYDDKIEIVSLLLEHGADVNCASRAGTTPIFSARSLEVAALLINKGANLKVVDKKGRNMLYYHINAQRKEITQYLREQVGEVCVKEDFQKAEIMTEDKFWAIVEKSYRAGKGDEARQCADIVRILRYMRPV